MMAKMVYCSCSMIFQSYFFTHTFVLVTWRYPGEKVFWLSCYHIFIFEPVPVSSVIPFLLARFRPHDLFYSLP